MTVLTRSARFDSVKRQVSFEVRESIQDMHVEFSDETPDL